MRKPFPLLNALFLGLGACAYPPDYPGHAPDPPPAGASSAQRHTYKKNLKNWRRQENQWRRWAAKNPGTAANRVKNPDESIMGAGPQKAVTWTPEAVKQADAKAQNN